MTTKAKNSYRELLSYSSQRREELTKLLSPYFEATEKYGSLVCKLFYPLGKTPPADLQDKVIRDLSADVFDSLYESRTLILSNLLHVAYPITRRAYESLSLLVLCVLDSAYAKKWHDGAKISNREVRKQLSQHPFGEKEEDLQEFHKFFCQAAHPNRDLIAERFLGEGNLFVFGAIAKPNLLSVTNYCIKHLGLWFWFAAVVSTFFRGIIDQHDSTYGSDYLARAKQAQETAEWLRKQYNQLIDKRDEEINASNNRTKTDQQ